LKRRLALRQPFNAFLSNTQIYRPYPNFGGITFRTNGARSNYHAGTVKLDKRFSNGFTFTTSYVFSKLLTDADSYWITDQGRAADQYNRGLEKSIGSYDVTHNFKFSGVYDIPFGKGRRWANKGIANAVIGGWRMSLIALYSGFVVLREADAIRQEVAGLPSSLPVDSARHARVDELHQLSTRLMLVNIIAALVLLYWEAREQ